MKTYQIRHDPVREKKGLKSWGVSPKAVQTFAGHSSLQVTMDRYGHLFKSEDHRKAMDSIAAEMLG